MERFTVSADLNVVFVSVLRLFTICAECAPDKKKKGNN